MSIKVNLQDGVSGIFAGEQKGQAMLVGCSEKGEPGKAYFVNPTTNLYEKFGCGPLTDRLTDLFSEAGADASVIAVPVRSIDYKPDSTSNPFLRTIKIDEGFIIGEWKVPISKKTGFVDNLLTIHIGAIDLVITGQRIVSTDPSTGLPTETETIELQEGTHYTRDGENITLIATDMVTLVDYRPYTGDESIPLTNGELVACDLVVVTVSYYFSVFEQNNNSFALFKYAKNITISPSVSYHVEFDSSIDRNILYIDSEMPESITCTYETCSLIPFQKSRTAAPDLTSFGKAKTACQLVVKFPKGGGLVPTMPISSTVDTDEEEELVISPESNWSVASYQISYDGGENFTSLKKVPFSGAIDLTAIGITLMIPSGPLIQDGDEYSLTLDEPEAELEDIYSAIEQPLELYDVEFVCVCGAVPSEAWQWLAAKADELWSKHRPTFFMCEYRMPVESECLDDWVSALLAERVQFSHPFVSCCPAFGSVSGTYGQFQRNLMGFVAGRLIKIPVMRSIGRVRDGGLSNVLLSLDYNSTHQKVLEEAGYITAKTHIGLKNVFFGSARTLAEDISDFQYIEIIRVIFKAARLIRMQALNSIHDEAGDPLMGANASGVAFLKASLESALGSMTVAIPKEMAGYVVTIPNGQDIVNNGLKFGFRLIGIPIIREIEINASYSYAGSQFDPRLETL